MHLCMASSIKAMPEKEKPLAMRVDLYCMWNRKQRVFGDIFLKNFFLPAPLGDDAGHTCV